MKQKYQISFSGGRTSAYMTKMLIDHLSDQYDFIVTFANTGLEHEKTLEFVNNCDNYFGFNTVWLEAVINPEKGQGTTHKIVTFETASRNGEPFHAMIQKYGIPNPSYLHCTRELKLQVMHSYLRSIGLNHKDIPTAIGIREDETRRVNKKANDVKIKYPLIDLFPSDKQDVLNWWSLQKFDLGLEEWDGNCKGCFKKSFKKIFKQLDSDPSILDFHIEMEEKYPQLGNKNPYYKNIYDMDDVDIADKDARHDFDPINNPKPKPKFIERILVQQPDRVFFRGQTSAKRLHEMYLEHKENPDYEDLQLSIFDGGCSESCEVYEVKS